MKVNIIPGLVTIDTELTGLRGFYLSEDFEYYGLDDESTNPYQYILNIGDVVIPEQYSFRNGYYTEQNGIWYYNRKFKFLTLSLSYNPQSRTFTISKSFLYIPFELGGIHPAGRIIADIINLELILDGIIVARGCAVDLGGDVLAMLGLSFNGKTTLVNMLLDKGARYISEDFVVFHSNKKLVYPVSPYHRRRNFARSSNKSLASKITKENTIVEPRNFTKLFLTQRSTNEQYEPATKSLQEFMILSGVAFLNSRISRSLLVERAQVQRFFEVFQSLGDIGIPVEFVSMDKFITQLWK